MSTRAPIDFAVIARAALNNAESLLTQWLPGGRMDGSEYKALNPTRADSKMGSFLINVRSGAWSDFATGDAGGDLVSLYAYLSNITQIDAAKVVAGIVGVALLEGVNSEPASTASVTQIKKNNPVELSSAKKEKTPWRPILPVPLDVVESPPVAHYKRGKPEKVWTYLDADGRVNGYIYLFRASDGTKETIPVCFAEHSQTGKLEWRWMAFPEPRPLYGLERLDKSKKTPVLLVEGEKCTDVAADKLTTFTPITWPGGSNAVGKSGFVELAGCEIYAWADCDAQRQRLTREQKAAGVDLESLPLLPEHEQPGMHAMLQIKALLMALDPSTRFHIVDIPKPGDKPSGWDISDAVAEGMDEDALKTFTSRVRRDPPAKTATVTSIAAAPKKPVKKERPVDWGRVNNLVDNFVLIYGTDTCFDMRMKMLLRVNHLRLAAGNDCVKMWLASEKRRMILPEQLVFDPTRKCKAPKINLFQGMAMEPAAGDCEAIMELLYHLCADSAETPGEIGAVVLWALKWLALPLQKVGTKMRSALVFHGPQGAGKNLLFEIVASIYGRYALVVGQEQIEDRFNDWASQKLFVIGDEVVARQELYHQKNKLKAFITGETIQINTKMMPLRTESNHVNVVFLSNEHQPLALEVGDRRYFVVYTPPMRDDDLYERVAKCIEDGGAAAFYHYLVNLDLGDFNAFTKPPMTTAKHDLIELGLKPPERFIREWLAGHLPLPLRSCSAAQLFRVFKTWSGVNGERFTPNQTLFTKSVNKTIQVLSARSKRGCLLRYKVAKLSCVTNGQRNERVWIPDGQGPSEGMTEGYWMAEEIKQFEYLIRTFIEQTGGQAS